MIRIFVADDHLVVREGLIALLETQPDFEVVGEAGNGQDTIRRIQAAATPDILFLDLEMPGMDGVAIINQLQNKGIEVKIIVFTVYDTDDRIMSAIKAGAQGYLLKGAAREEIYQAVRIVHAGGSLLQPVIASKLFNQLSDDTEKLSSREIEVLQQVAKGLTNQEIGKILFISERTVKFHVSAILQKLNASNRTEAVQIAVQKRIIRF